MRPRKLHSNIAKLMRHWHVADHIEDDPILGEGDLGMFEHALHEVAHAQLLSIAPFDRHSIKAISSALNMLDGEVLFGRLNNAIRHEEQAWAIEWLLWDTFKLRPPWEWGDLVDHAVVQDADPDQIRRFLRQPHIPWMARNAAREIRRLSKLGAAL